MEILFDSVTIDCSPCSYDRLEPIHLTKEILEKNFHDTGILLLYGVEIEIKYVHQLQHILRLCDIEDEVQL